MTAVTGFLRVMVKIAKNVDERGQDPEDDNDRRGGAVRRITPLPSSRLGQALVQRIPIVLAALTRASKSARNLVRKPSIGQAAASPSAQMVLPPMPLAMLASSSTSPGLALAAREPLAEARQPARALAAGGALAARLVGVELP